MKRVISIILTLVVLVGLLIPFSIPVAAGTGYLPARWHFAGNAYDTGDTLSNNGTVLGGATYDSSGNRTSLVLDGANDYVLVSDATSLDLTSELTVEAWVKVDAFSTGYQSIIVKGWDGSENYEILIGPDGKVEVAITWNDLSRSYPSSNHAISAGAWHHIALTYDSFYILKIYVDGVLDGEESHPGRVPRSNSSPLYIGAEYSPLWDPELERYFDGYIDEVRIWNIALGAYQLGYYTTPLIDITNPSDGGIYYSGSVPGAGFSYQGQLLGAILPSGYSADPGTHTYTVSATDYFGTPVSDSHTYCVLDPTKPSTVEGRKAHYYSVVTKPIAWTAAETEAKGLPPYTPTGSSLTYYPHLVSITSQAEQDFIEGLTGANQQLWIGGTDAAREGTWKWSTGERVGKYTNWASSEPNGSTSQNWMMWDGTDSYLWKDYTHATLAGYIVEWEVRAR